MAPQNFKVELDAVHQPVLVMTDDDRMTQRAVTLNFQAGFAGVANMQNAVAADAAAEEGRPENLLRALASGNIFREIHSENDALEFWENLNGANEVSAPGWAGVESFNVPEMQTMEDNLGRFGFWLEPLLRE
ncbi:hypothetical protein N7540_000250 [Penicillium herquei]|nr:hypothetical protein N7540_000250 [Penicillium herquei]